MINDAHFFPPAGSKWVDFRGRLARVLRTDPVRRTVSYMKSGRSETLSIEGWWGRHRRQVVGA